MGNAYFFITLMKIIHFMIRPKYLKKGDTIAIVSTARKVTKNELNASVLLLKKWDLKVIYGASIGAEHYQFAGDDSLRAPIFKKC